MVPQRIFEKFCIQAWPIVILRYWFLAHLFQLKMTSAKFFCFLFVCFVCLVFFCYIFKYPNLFIKNKIIIYATPTKALTFRRYFIFTEKTRACFNTFYAVTGCLVTDFVKTVFTTRRVTVRSKLWRRTFWKRQIMKRYRFDLYMNS